MHPVSNANSSEISLRVTSFLRITMFFKTWSSDLLTITLSILFIEFSGGILTSASFLRSRRIFKIVRRLRVGFLIVLLGMFSSSLNCIFTKSLISLETFFYISS
jgi:hypothetical protein